MKEVKMRISKEVVIALATVALTGGLAYASGGEGHHVDSGVLFKDFIYRVVNFAIVVGVLVYFVRKPLKNALAGRSKEIENALQEAEKIKQEAEQRFSEYDRKLAKANEEIASLSATIKREGELEQERILASAKEMAIKIEQEAGQAAELEISKARKALQAEAVALAVDLAENLLKEKFNPQDDSRLINEYLQKMGELH